MSTQLLPLPEPLKNYYSSDATPDLKQSNVSRLLLQKTHLSRLKKNGINIAIPTSP